MAYDFRTSLTPFPRRLPAFTCIPACLYRGLGTIDYVLPEPLQSDFGYYGVSVAIQVAVQQQPAQAILCLSITKEASCLGARFAFFFPIGKCCETTDYESNILILSYVSLQRLIHLFFVAAYVKAAQAGVQKIHSSPCMTCTDSGRWPMAAIP